MKNPIYYPSEEQKSFARTQAKLRNDAKPDSIRDKTTRGNHSSEEAHRIGIMAEIAYGDIVNEQIDTKIHPHGDSVDFVVREVRASTWKGEDIELKVKKSEYLRKTPEVYILTRVSEDLAYVEFIGCITREKFDKVKFIKNYGYGDNYCVGVDQLTKGLPVMINGEIKYISFDMVNKIIKNKSVNV